MLNKLRCCTLLGLGFTIFHSPMTFASDKIQVMTYNVENLFDTKHDAGKDDYTYLPLSEKNTPEVKEACNRMRSSAWKKECLTWDWNDAVVHSKLQRLSEVMLSANGGAGADIIVMPEVENIAILEQFRSEFMASHGYETAVLVEGDDGRGIDVGMISKLPLARPAKIHQIPFKDNFTSRGILEASFTLPNTQVLTVFGVHFPAGSHPTEYREQAINFLNEIGERATADADIVMAAGDFNINTNENDRLFKNNASRHWKISHLIGCNDCKGTEYYRGENHWSFLDAILLYQHADHDAGRNGDFRGESIRVIDNLPFQTTKDGIPIHFDPVSGRGLSDHLPMEGSVLIK